MGYTAIPSRDDWTIIGMLMRKANRKEPTAIPDVSTFADLARELDVSGNGADFRKMMRTVGVDPAGAIPDPPAGW